MTHISPERRDKSSTVHIGKGKKKRGKFPVDDTTTANSAAKEINRAKPPLTSSQRASVVSKIHKYLPGRDIPPPKGHTKKGSSRGST